MKDTVLITEGKTLLFVPKGSQESNAPPKTPAFFNPRARINRDMSLLAYGAVAEDYGGDLTYLDALCGLGARGLRVANELDGFENIILNDANPNAIQMAHLFCKFPIKELPNPNRTCSLCIFHAMWA